MAVLSKARQGRRGVGGSSRSGSSGSRAVSSSSTPARKTTQPGIRQRNTGAGCSPRLHLAHTRTPANTSGRRFSSAKQNTKVNGGTDSAASSTGANTSRSNSSSTTTSVGARAGDRTVATAGVAGTGVRKRSAKVDAGEVSKTMSVLRSDLTAALEKAMGEVEAECGEFVTTALNGSAAGMSGREQDRETGEAALREMDTRQAAITAQCTGMLKTVESNGTRLSAMVDRCNVALDRMQQAESRKLKSALDRATGVLS